jgi:hypothetical protein
MSVKQRGDETGSGLEMTTGWAHEDKTSMRVEARATKLALAVARRMVGAGAAEPASMVARSRARRAWHQRPCRPRNGADRGGCTARCRGSELRVTLRFED